MENLIDLKTLLLFIGGLFSLILTVGIYYSKQQYKRELERKRLKDVQQSNPKIGDIEEKLNDFYDFRKLSFLQELINYGIQPLVIISFVNLFDTPSVVDVVATFSLTIFAIMHELWARASYSKKIPYQILLLVCWIGLFFIINLKNIQPDNGQQADQQLHPRVDG